MKALVIGATGATGKDLVNILLADKDYEEVVLFLRRSTGLTHPKLMEVITDFEKLEELSNFIKGDVMFSCLGTTLKAAGSKDKQRHIDYDIPAKFAEIAKRNGVSKVVLLSAYGASSTSKVFYSRIKGELEEFLQSLNFGQFIIFRPGLLLRNNTDRIGEQITGRLLKFLNALGLIRKFRPLPTYTLAKKMAKAPRVVTSGIQLVELDKIFGF